MHQEQRFPGGWTQKGYGLQNYDRIYLPEFSPKKMKINNVSTTGMQLQSVGAKGRWHLWHLSRKWWDGPIDLTIWIIWGDYTKQKFKKYNQNPQFSFRITREADARRIHWNHDTEK